MITLHPQVKQTLDAVMADQPHAVLLAGKVGVGLKTIADYYLAQTSAQPVLVLPEKKGVVDLDGGTISVESVRKLYDVVRVAEPQGRIVIIDQAEKMLHVSQNAFLKLLEEPNDSTRFILLSHAPELLLPTILSRVQRVDVRPVTHEQSEALLDAHKVYDATKRAQLLFMADGLPAELTRLVTDDDMFAARVAVVKDARTFASGTAYDRLLLAKAYKDSREKALLLLDDALKQLQLTLAKTGDEATFKLMKRLEVLHKRLTEQGNVRLQLSAAAVV